MYIKQNIVIQLEPLEAKSLAIYYAQYNTPGHINGLVWDVKWLQLQQVVCKVNDITNSLKKI